MGNRVWVRLLIGAFFCAALSVFVPVVHAASPAPPPVPLAPTHHVFLPRTSGMAASFTYTPTSGAVGSSITVNGACLPDGLDIPPSGPATIGLFHMPDGTLIDVKKGLAGARWKTTLRVNPTTLGAAEIRLFCERSSFDPATTPRDQAQSIHPFRIVAGTTARTDGSTPSPAASVLALPAKTTSSSFPVLPMLFAVAGVAAIGGVVFARKPLLAAVGVGSTVAAQTNGHKKTKRKDDGKHPLCVASWDTTFDLTSSARGKTAKRLARDLGDIGAKFSELQTTIDGASAAFAPLRGDKEDDAPSDAELELANRILDALGKAVGTKR